MPLLEENMLQIDWLKLHWNPNSLPLLSRYPDKINWNRASKNPHLFPLLKENVDKINWPNLCEKPTPEMIHFMEQHVDKLCGECWKLLSYHPNAIPLLQKYPEYIYWDRLSRNPAAIPLLEQNPEKINWSHLSANPNATHLLFRLDHERMRQQNEGFHTELAAYVFDPDRVFRMSSQYGLDMRSYLQLT